jgi:uncharacterized protein
MRSKKAYRVQRSPIHGKGVFATRDIPIHTKIGVYEGVPATRNSRFVLMITLPNFEEVWILGTNELRFLNHSVPGNAYFKIGGKGDVLYSRRNILKGQEITFDYGMDPNA